MKNLGLDLSTAVCGWAITENKKLIDAGFFDISKVDTYKQKALIIMDGLEDKEFDVINVEENLSGFAFGKTSQQTLLKLAKNKAVVCYILEEVWQRPFRFANATTMRKQLFGKARIKGIKPKDYVKAEIEKMYDVTPWVKMNKIGNVDKKMEDLYDAIVVSCYEPL